MSAGGDENSAKDTGLAIEQLDVMMLSLWGQRATGLPIDCQVQNQAEWVEYDGPVSPRGTIS